MRKHRGTVSKRAVTILSGPVALQGDLTVPTGAEAIVLFAHGSGSSRHSTRNQFVARALAEAGLGTLLMDLLTEEEETRDLVTMELRFDIPLLAERLMGATEWVASQETTSRMRIGYFGASTGAAAALIAAAERPELVGAVVSRGGRPDLAGQALARVRAPTLLIVGGNDDTVLSLNEEALDRMTCERNLGVIAGATHLFEEPGALGQVATLASRWFRKHLQGLPVATAAHSDQADEEVERADDGPDRGHSRFEVPFRDRREAGRLLAKELRRRGFARPVVLGIPRGGVPLAAEVAAMLKGDLGVIVARKLRAPMQPELAIGAVTADGTLYVDWGTAALAGADVEYVEAEANQRAEEARRREERFNGHRLLSLQGRTVIVVDDGIATGATAIAAVRSIKARGAGKVVLAVPVGSPSSTDALRKEADEVVCMVEDPAFFAVGEFYVDFSQVEDDDVDAILRAYEGRSESTDAR